MCNYHMSERTHVPRRPCWHLEMNNLDGIQVERGGSLADLAGGGNNGGGRGRGRMRAAASLDLLAR